jgi:hypothetical protein
MTRVRHAAVAVAAVAMVLAFGPTNLGAQSIEQFDKTYGFIGHWDAEINNPEGQDRGNCGGRKGDYGEKLLNCAMPIDQLPLNGRGEAWLKYMDHRQSPVMAECAQLAVPSLLSADSYWNAALTELVIYYADPSGLITRHIYMDGRKHPDPSELFQHGHSIGWWEGDDLIVESTNFTFDPDGTDEHLHMASSVRKKVIERYHLIDENTMRLTITLEDSTFLTRPFTWAFYQSKKPGGAPTAWRACDPESGRNEVYSAYPGNKYGEDDHLGVNP